MAQTAVQKIIQVATGVIHTHQEAVEPTTKAEEALTQAVNPSVSTTKIKMEIGATHQRLMDGDSD